MSSQLTTKRAPRRKAASGGVGTALAVLLLCCGGGLLSLDEDEDENEANGTPYRPRVLSTEMATPAISGPPTTVPDPSASSEPQDTPPPTSTTDTRRAACVTRSERSAAAVHFDEDYSDICAYVPDYDFGVSAKKYHRCVRKAQEYHVKSYMYESTCRYDHTYRWSDTDDPDYMYAPDAPDYTYKTAVPDYDYDPGDSDHSYTPNVPDHDYDPGEADNGSGIPSDDVDLSDDLHAGCTWVNSYHRKDGTYVRGHYRC